MVHEKYQGVALAYTQVLNYWINNKINYNDDNFELLRSYHTGKKGVAYKMQWLFKEIDLKTYRNSNHRTYYHEMKKDTESLDQQEKASEEAKVYKYPLGNEKCN